MRNAIHSLSVNAQLPMQHSSKPTPRQRFQLDRQLLRNLQEASLSSRQQVVNPKLVEMPFELNSSLRVFGLQDAIKNKMKKQRQRQPRSYVQTSSKNKSGIRFRAPFISVDGSRIRDIIVTDQRLKTTACKKESSTSVDRTTALRSPKD